MNAAVAGNRYVAGILHVESDSVRRHIGISRYGESAGAAATVLEDISPRIHGQVHVGTETKIPAIRSGVDSVIAVGEVRHGGASIGGGRRQSGQRVAGAVSSSGRCGCDAG